MSPLVSLDSRGSLRFSAPAPAPAQLPSLLECLLSLPSLGGTEARRWPSPAAPPDQPTDRPPARRHTPPNRSKRRNKKTVLGRPLPHRAYMYTYTGVPSPSHTLLVFTESTLLVHVKNEDPA